MLLGLTFIRRKNDGLQTVTSHHLRPHWPALNLWKTRSNLNAPVGLPESHKREPHARGPSVRSVPPNDSPDQRSANDDDRRTPFDLPPPQYWSRAEWYPLETS